MTDYTVGYKLGYIQNEMEKLNRNVERLSLNLGTINETLKEEGRLNRLVTLIAAGIDPDKIDFTKIQ